MTGGAEVFHVDAEDLPIATARDLLRDSLLNPVRRIIPSVLVISRRMTKNVVVYSLRG